MTRPNEHDGRFFFWLHNIVETGSNRREYARVFDNPSLCVGRLRRLPEAEMYSVRCSSYTLRS